MSVRFPYHFDASGRTAAPEAEEHLRALIEQVLFTAPGERVNRPGFGSGVHQLLFSPISEELTATTKMLVQSALQQWLGDLIQVNAVQVTSDDAKLHVTVRYAERRTGETKTATFSRGGEPA